MNIDWTQVQETVAYVAAIGILGAIFGAAVYVWLDDIFGGNK